MTAAGESLELERREIMLRRALGLTKLYNLVNDPDVQLDKDVTRLRQIHVEIDEAVVEAYGWTLPMTHGFHSYRQQERWTVNSATRVALLDLLLEENFRRASSALPDGTGSKGRTDSNEEGTLFD